MRKRSILLAMLCLIMLSGCRKNTPEPGSQKEPANTLTAETTIVPAEREIEWDIPEESVAIQSTTAPETIAEEVQEQEESWVETEATTADEIIWEEADIPEIYPYDSEIYEPSPAGKYELQERDFD